MRADDEGGGRKRMPIGRQLLVLLNECGVEKFNNKNNVNSSGTLEHGPTRVSTFTGYSSGEMQ